MDYVFELICPTCKKRLTEDAQCVNCGRKYTWLNQRKIISFQLAPDEAPETRYDGMWHRSETSLALQNLVAPIRERISLSTRRERFFRKNLHRNKGEPLILEVACGYGRRLLTKYGRVVGLDIVLKPLLKTCESYALCVHADVFSIPFPDEYFDYLVSSDFLGHIPLDKKDNLYKEFHRVLKPKGKMLHVFETDANNRAFRFAHKYPILFQKYFVEKPGHVGLELPSKAIQRIKASGFKIIRCAKIWGEVWPIGGYWVFDNEYKGKSTLIKTVTILSKLLTRFVVVREVVDVILNPISALLERLTPLDNGQGLMVVCQRGRHDGKA